jgi:hypothetical protein
MNELGGAQRKLQKKGEKAFFYDIGSIIIYATERGVTAGMYTKRN